ncbi:MAG: TetR/AcrR family transcriptional regulator [Actinomycetes bacterium]
MTATEGVRAARLPREQRRQQVLAAALEVFSSSGYHAASMDEIAEHAGVSKPVLYQHFPGKLDLYLALLDAGIDELRAAANAALTTTTDNRERVSGMVTAYFAFVEDPAGAFRLVFESDLANEPQVRQRVDAANLVLAQQTAAVIAEDTGLSDEQALLLASGMQGMVQVAARRWLAGDAQSVSREEAAELITALAWRGIRGFPRTHPPHDEGT